MATTKTEDWFPEARYPASTQLINDRCLLRTQDTHRVVLVSGIILAQYTVADRMAEAHVMVSLVEQGWAYQNEVACTFGCSVRTLGRHLRRFQDGGLAALGHGNGYPSGQPRVKGARTRLVEQFKAAGLSNREIARRVGVSETAVRKLLRRLGWQAPSVEPGLLALPSEPSANPSLSAPPLSAPSPQRRTAPSVC